VGLRGREGRHRICQDRRYPESYRALALQGAEIILIGYNTPSPRSRWTSRPLHARGAVRQRVLSSSALPGRVEDGVELIGGSSVITLGQIVAKATTTGDELVPRASTWIR